MSNTRWVYPGEKGIDASYTYPSGAGIRAKDYTFAVGYVSSNPLKNLPKAKAQDWIDNGLTVFLVWEVNAGWTNKGCAQGVTDSLWAMQQAQAIGYPVEVAVIAANDTNTVPTNRVPQTEYMECWHDSGTPYPLGEYMDLDLAFYTMGLWEIGWLPNAYRWSVPPPYPKSVAIQKARELGYHFIQGRLSDDITEPSYDSIEGIGVDINHCIRPALGWGNPVTQPTEKDMKVITNTEPFVIGATTWPPGFVKWSLGTVRRHLEEAEWIKVYNSDPGIGMTNAEILAIPEYVPPGSLSGATFITQSTSQIQ